MVWFGEDLPAEALAAAEQASANCDVFLCVGTSTVVYPAAGLPFAALRAGAVVIEVNPEPTPLTARVPYALRGGAGQILPALVRTVWG